MGKLSASILSADLAHLTDQVGRIEAFTDVFHVDVTDGRFVPPLTIGPVVVASLRPHTGRTLHGHLMVEAPEGLLDELAEAGTDVVSLHVEAVSDVGPLIGKVRGAGMGVGLAVNPETPVEALRPHLEDVDDVIVVSAHPTGGAFVPEVLPKVEAVRAEIERRGLGVDVEVDGGVRVDDARRCVEAGANVLVAASAIFGASDPTAAARELRAIVESA